MSKKGLSLSPQHATLWLYPLQAAARLLTRPCS